MSCSDAELSLHSLYKPALTHCNRFGPPRISRGLLCERMYYPLPMRLLIRSSTLVPLTRLLLKISPTGSTSRL